MGGGSPAMLLWTESAGRSLGRSVVRRSVGRGLGRVLLQRRKGPRSSSEDGIDSSDIFQSFFSV